LEPVAALPLEEAAPSPTTSPAEDVETITAAQSTGLRDADPVPDPVAEPVPAPVVSAVAAETHGEPEPLVKPDDEPDPDVEVEVEAPVEAGSPPARHTPRRSGRPSVPSWDDIVFGTKPKDPRP
jgi:hypothetical protein